MLEFLLGIVREPVFSLTFRDQSQALDVLHLKSESSLVMNPLSSLNGCSLDFLLLTWKLAFIHLFSGLAISTSSMCFVSVQMIE